MCKYNPTPSHKTNSKQGLLIIWPAKKQTLFRNKLVLRLIVSVSGCIMYMQCLSQDLETGCLKLAVVKFLGVQIFKEDHNILRFQP